MPAKGSMNVFCFPVLGLGPMHLEWSAAAYERLAASREAYAAGRSSSTDLYTGAAYEVESGLLGAIHRAGRGRNLPWDERKQL